MDTMIESLFNTLGKIVFCAAVVLLMMNTHYISDLSGTVNNSNSIIYTDYKEKKKPVITYDQEIAVFISKSLESNITP